MFANYSKLYPQALSMGRKKVIEISIKLNT